MCCAYALSCNILQRVPNDGEGQHVQDLLASNCSWALKHIIDNISIQNIFWSKMFLELLLLLLLLCRCWNWLTISKKKNQETYPLLSFFSFRSKFVFIDNETLRDSHQFVWPRCTLHLASWPPFLQAPWLQPPLGAQCSCIHGETGFSAAVAAVEETPVLWKGKIHQEPAKQEK